FGTARAFATPPARALTADVVPRERLPWLVVRQSAMWQAALIVGPVLGGFLYVLHKSAPFLAAVVLLGCAAVAVTTVELAPGAHRGSRAKGTRTPTPVRAAAGPTGAPALGCGVGVE